MWLEGCELLFLHVSGSTMQPVTLSLSSPTINSSRSGPLSSGTDYSETSSRNESLTSPDSAASLFQRRTQQLGSGRDDSLFHFSPGGAPQKGEYCKVLSHFIASHRSFQDFAVSCDKWTASHGKSK